MVEKRNYLKETVVNNLNEKLQAIDLLYKSSILNRIGLTKDTKEYYTEVYSEELLNNIKKLDSIKRVTRKKSYFVNSHLSVNYTITSNRHEDMFSKRLMGLNLSEIGYVLDYQIPLKDTNKDKGLGKIDLLTYQDHKERMHIVELKYGDNKETLLRAVLECYTYFKTVNLEILIADYINEYTSRVFEFDESTNSSNIKIVPTVLLSKSCNAYKELKEMEKGLRPNLKELVDKLGVEIYTIEINCKKH